MSVLAVRIRFDWLTSTVTEHASQSQSRSEYQYQYQYEYQCRAQSIAARDSRVWRGPLQRPPVSRRSVPAFAQDSVWDASKVQEYGVQGTEYRSQGTGHRAQGTESGVQSPGYGAWGIEYRAQCVSVKV